MKVFLDTNILLDVLLERDGFEDGVALLQLNEEGKIKACTSALSIMNIAYVYRKTVGAALIVPNIKQLVSIVKVLPVDESIIQEALYLSGDDYEDVVQFVCAAKGKCDCLVTRNIKHYNISAGLAPECPVLPVYTPEVFIHAMA